MDYYVTKKVNNKEWRIYFDEESKTTGRILFKGHKASLNVEKFGDILEYKLERSSGTYYFIDYTKLQSRPNIRDREMWFVGTNPIELIRKSWDSLESKLREFNPNLKKILISENFT